MIDQPEGYRCVMCLNDRKACFYGKAAALTSKSRAGGSSSKAPTRRRSTGKKRSVPPSPPSPSPPPTASSSIVVRRNPRPPSQSSRPSSQSSRPSVSVVVPRKKRSNLSSYREPAVDSPLEVSSFPPSPAVPPSPGVSSLALDDDRDTPTGSGSNQFNLKLMRIQLRASQDDLRVARAQLASANAIHAAELEAYRHRVAELEAENRGRGRRET